MGDEGLDKYKLDIEALKKAEKQMEVQQWQKFQFAPPPRSLPSSPFLRSQDIIRWGTGSPPLMDIALGQTLHRDPTTWEWALVREPRNGLGKLPNAPKPNDDNEGLQATVNLLKEENAKLWKMLEALARRMDRMEFNAEIEDDDDRSAGGNEETPASEHGGTGVSGPEGESVSVSA